MFKNYLKVYNITNKETGDNVTKEEFDLFVEKFEKIRDLYLNDGKEKFDSFRSITKEILRSAHNAGLIARLVSVEYTRISTDMMKVSTYDISDINLLVFIEPTDKKNFHVKQIRFIDNIETEMGYINFNLLTDKKEVPDYAYMRGNEDGYEYIYRCIDY